MHDAGAVEEHVDRAGLADDGGDGRIVQHVEDAGGDTALVGKAREGPRVDIRGKHRRAGALEGERGRPPDALPRRRHQNGLAFEIAHDVTPVCA